MHLNSQCVCKSIWTKCWNNNWTTRTSIKTRSWSVALTLSWHRPSLQYFLFWLQYFCAHITNGQAQDIDIKLHANCPFDSNSRSCKDFRGFRGTWSTIGFFLTSNSATHHDVPPSSKFLEVCQNWNLRPAVWCCCERENFGPNDLMGEEMHEHAGKDVDDNLYTLCSLSGDKPIILKDSVLPLYPCLSCFDFDSLGSMHPGSVV